MPSFEAVDKASRLERELEVLKLRFDTLNQAFHAQELELSHLSADYLESKKGCVDLATVRDMIKVLQKEKSGGLYWLDMFKAMGIKQNDDARMSEWNKALSFLKDVGLVTKSPDGHIQVGTCPLRRPEERRTSPV